MDFKVHVLLESNNKYNLGQFEHESFFKSIISIPCSICGPLVGNSSKWHILNGKGVTYPSAMF